MVEIVRLPKLGLSDYGELIAWEADVGDAVSKDQVVAVLESDKASAEIESPTDGVLLKTYVEEGEEIAIEVGKPLAVIGAEGEAVPSLDKLDNKSEEKGSSKDEPTPAVTQLREEQSSPPASDVKATPRAKRRAQEEDIELGAIEGTGPQGAITEGNVEQYLEEEHLSQPSEDVKATPRAKRRAQGENINLGAVEGTGPQGAVTEDDIEQYLPTATEKGENGAATSAGNLTVSESRELTGIKKTIADRLSQSAREKPHVMGTREVSIEHLEQIRDHLDENHGVDVSINDLLLYLIGIVLNDLPEFNAHFEDGQHKLIDEINVGYAVDGPRGLVVPVISDMGGISLPELAETRRTLVQRVLDDNFNPSDLKGGTFTITNVGVFDMDISYSIINPPEVAILAIGRRKYAPVERDGDVELEKVITLSLTIDHRVLDGADSGAFLEQLAEYIEYPGLVLDAV